MAYPCSKNSTESFRIQLKGFPMKEILSFPICHHCTFLHFHVLYSFIVTCFWLANTRYPYPIHDSFPPLPHFCNSALHHSVHFYPITHHISLLLLSAQVRSHSLFCFQSLYTLSCPFQRQIWFISRDRDASKGPELMFAELMPSPVLLHCLGFTTAHHDFLQHTDFLSHLLLHEVTLCSSRSTTVTTIITHCAQCVSEALRAFTSSSGRWDVRGFNEEIDQSQVGKSEIRSFWLNPISTPCHAEGLVMAEAISF